MKQQGTLDVAILKVVFQEGGDVGDIGRGGETVDQTAKHIPAIAAIAGQNFQGDLEALKDRRPRANHQILGMFLHADPAEQKAGGQVGRRRQDKESADRHQDLVGIVPQDQIKKRRGGKKQEQEGERRPAAYFAGSLASVFFRIVGADDGRDGRPGDRVEHQAEAAEEKEEEGVLRQGHGSGRGDRGQTGTEDERHLSTHRHPVAQIQGSEHAQSGETEVQSQLPVRSPQLFLGDHGGGGQNAAGDGIEQGVEQVIAIGSASVSGKRRRVHRPIHHGKPFSCIDCPGVISIPAMVAADDARPVDPWPPHLAWARPATQPRLRGPRMAGGIVFRLDDGKRKIYRPARWSRRTAK